MIGVVALSAIASSLAVAFLSVALCNYLIPATLLTAMIVLLYVGIFYQRNVTKLLKDSGLFCSSCHQPAIPTPDRIRFSPMNTDHGIQVCYHCGTDLTDHP